MKVIKHFKMSALVKNKKYIYIYILLKNMIRFYSDVIQRKFRNIYLIFSKIVKIIQICMQK